MSWEALNNYELRDLPAHLMSAARWSDVREVVFDTEYLRVTLRRLGLLELTQTLNELIVDPAMPEELVEELVLLRRIVIQESAFLAAEQYTGYDGPFGNHLISVWIRSNPDSRSPLWCELNDVEQEGWLDLTGCYGSSIRRGSRFFMPGERESHGWDSYDSGTAGVQTSLAVDLRRMRLLGQTMSMFYSQYGGGPDHYDWRIWDLRSGAQLYERSSGAQNMRVGNKDVYMPIGGQPAAFDDPDLARGVSRSVHHGKSVPKLLAGQIRRMQAVLKCANGTELLFVGADGNDSVRAVVTDARRQRIVVEDQVPPSVDPRLLIRLDGQFVVFCIGTDGHIYRIDLGTVPTADFGPAPVLPAAPTEVIHCFWKPGQRSYVLELESGSADGSVTPQKLELEQPPGGQGNDITSGFQEGFLESSGRFIIARNMLDIGVWHYPSGRWADHLAMTNSRVGGAGVLRGGCAVSPDGRHLISSYDSVYVWNLDELARGYQGTVEGGYRLPHWKLGDIELPARLTKLAFLWGGRLVAAATEQHELLILRFWPNSAILARVGLDDDIEHLIGERYGGTIICVGKSGRITTYRFRYLPKDYVSTLDGRNLTVRLQRPAAHSVEVAGSFTAWETCPLELDDRGIWHAEFDLPTGDHEYKLLVDGADWELDPHLPFRPGPVAENNYVTVLPDTRPRLASATSAMRS